MIASSRARPASYRRSRGGCGGFGADTGAIALRTGRAGFGGDVGCAGGLDAAESELLPARPGGARAGATGRGAQVGRPEGTAAGSDGGFLCGFAERTGSGRG